jgi:TATA-box binding protein (TBP) (component of TFIID and TFIIIB)
MINWDKIEFKDLINLKENEVDNLPKGIAISTMCSSCKLNINVNVQNILEHMELDTFSVMTIKKSSDTMRTLLPQIQKKTRVKRKKVEEKPVIKEEEIPDNSLSKPKANSKKTKNYFYNQVTMVIRVTHNETEDLSKEPKINLKLFSNGSIQMSGCMSITNVNIALNKLLALLKQKKDSIKYIVDNIEPKIEKFKIDMINCNYQVIMEIDRIKLYDLLLKKKIKSSYEPCIRACVIIKYCPDIDNPDQKDVSIFIFQKGNIIITGARSKNQVIYTYNYINKILLDHIDEIIKKEEEEEEKILIEISNSIIKDIKLGIIKLT